MNETNEKIQSAHKTKPSPSAAGFKSFRVNQNSQSFQTALSVSTSQLDEDITNLRSSMQSRSEKNIIQNALNGVNAHLDKLSCSPSFKMQNSDSIIIFASTISNLVGVFKSISCTQDWKALIC